MAKVTKAQLISVAEELNDQLGLKPPIKTTGTHPKILAEITEAVDELQRTDEISERTINIFEQLGLTKALELLGLSVESEPEVEQEPEELEQTQDDLEQEDDLHPDEDVREEVTEDPPEPDDEPEEGIEDPPEPEQEKSDTVDSVVDVDKLIDRMEERGMITKRKKRTEGSSSYTIALPLACKNIEVTFNELCDLVHKKAGIEINSTSKPGIRTAHSIVQKIVGMLREYGHMSHDPVQRPNANKKPRAKK